MAWRRHYCDRRIIDNVMTRGGACLISAAWRLLIGDDGISSILSISAVASSVAAFQ